MRAHLYSAANSKRFGEANLIGEPSKFDPRADEMAGRMDADLITEVGSLWHIKEDPRLKQPRELTKMLRKSNVCDRLNAVTFGALTLDFVGIAVFD